MITVLSVFGTRPEAIKMAPVVGELARFPDRVRSIVCVTAQHREMLDQVLELFQIRPDFDLDIMRPNQTLTQLTAALLPALEGVVERVQPDLVLLQGDTTTAMAAALVAYYRKVRVGHVEAGLRTGDKFRPYPEEINRKLADALSDLYFAPTEAARGNLLREGVDDRRVSLTGNTVVDALLQVAEMPYDWSAGPLARVPRDKELITVTAHRRESFGAPFRELCFAIRDLAERYLERCHFVYPVHLNPAVQEPVREILTGIGNVSLVEPLDYLSLVHLLKNSVLVLTDSGGLQEEAPALDVPVLVMREVTERSEGLVAGTARLVGTERDSIVSGVSQLLDSPADRAQMARARNPYGDGRAAERIVRTIVAHAAMQPAGDEARSPISSEG